MNKKLCLVWILSLLLIGCSTNDDDTIIQNNENIELVYQTNNYYNPTLKSSVTEALQDAETKIENLYIFLFPITEEQSFKKYFIESPSFTNGKWNSVDGKVSLNITQTEASNRNVYIVANCLDLKRQLDEVRSLSDLKNVLLRSETPWTPQLEAPILMSGNTTHNFNSNYQLSDIPLVRCIAKIELNITLSEPYSDYPLSNGQVQYKYRFIDFDENTYVVKLEKKLNSVLRSSDWIDFNNSSTVSGYTLNSDGKITNLSIITYINERDDIGSTIELSIPYKEGFLPPPEFGNETYTLKFPTNINRNNWYKYDIQLGSDKKVLQISSNTSLYKERSLKD